MKANPALVRQQGDAGRKNGVRASAHFPVHPGEARFVESSLPERSSIEGQSTCADGQATSGLHSR